MTLFDDAPAAEAPPAPPPVALRDPANRAKAAAWLRRRLLVVCRFRHEDQGADMAYATRADAERLILNRKSFDGVSRALVEDVFGGRPAVRVGDLERGAT